MSFIADLKTLIHLTMTPARGKTHAERLENFYKNQASGYDDFRRRLLKGRRELYESILVSDGTVWIDMGGGTGSNVEFVVPHLNRVAAFHIVDLSQSLLDVAAHRIKQRQWTNVHTHCADVTTFALPADSGDGLAGVITFSYSLTMIPDWIAAVDRAYELLRPGGTIGLVDFYVSPKYPPAGQTTHPWITRTFWPTWFAADNVFLNPDHPLYLSRKFQAKSLLEQRAHVPYIPLGKVPYYTFVGVKPGA